MRSVPCPRLLPLPSATTAREVSVLGCRCRRGYVERPSCGLATGAGRMGFYSDCTDQGRAALAARLRADQTGDACWLVRQDRELLKLTEVWDSRIGGDEIQYHLVCASGEQGLNSFAHAIDPTPGNYRVKQPI